MRNTTESELTDVVLERYESTTDPRLREIMQSLIRHLHAFAREVKLTEPEWMTGIQFLTRTGQISDDKRQEMILLSDNVGLSSLVNKLTASVEEGATETTVIGPFYVPGSPPRGWGESILLRESNEPPLIIHGRVRDAVGRPIPHAKIEVWQADNNGMYDIQDSNQPEDNLRGTYSANDAGEFLIRTIRPTSYPIPTDGPVGELLKATCRHPYRPAHVHAIVSAPGYHTITTHLFDADDEYLDSDAVFAVKASLIRSFTKNTSPSDAQRYGLETPFWELGTDFVLTKLSN